MHFQTIIIAENEQTGNLFPFSVMHPVWEIRCGAYRLFEKVRLLNPGKNILFAGREKQFLSFSKRFGIPIDQKPTGNILIIDASVLSLKDLFTAIDTALSDYFKNSKADSLILLSEGKPVAALIVENKMENIIGETIDKGFQAVNDLISFSPSLEIGKINKIEYMWDAIEYNEISLKDDFSVFEGINPYYADFQGVHFTNQEEIKIKGGCSIMPNVVIDATEGPVMIGCNVTIMPAATIMGPCYIGDNSIIKIGAKIYEKTSIGERCKVGGEVENSIIQSYSNKQHDGFLGHSFLSEWVNLGADTNTSDLKNTYGNIKVKFRNKEIDTGRMFLGILCGDHTKTAIATSFTTGTIAGICSSLITDGYLPKYIESFTFGGGKDTKLFDLDKALEIARVVMKRRGRELTPLEEELIKSEFEFLRAC
jgi:UDP-N-acetylglucosamine diphosphorylase/glucosamine-1-phosphate N-acetyltransferase